MSVVGFWKWSRKTADTRLARHDGFGELQVPFGVAGTTAEQAVALGAVALGAVAKRTLLDVEADEDDVMFANGVANDVATRHAVFTCCCSIHAMLLHALSPWVLLTNLPDYRTASFSLAIVWVFSCPISWP